MGHRLVLELVESEGIENFYTDVNSQVIVELIVNFAKQMNIKTIGEFVHNEAVYQIVKDNPVDWHPWDEKVFLN